jgi:hypothetical protein
LERGFFSEGMKLNEKIKSLVSGASAFFMVFGLIALFIYFVFIRDGLINKEMIGKSNIAFQRYMDSPTLENAKQALDEFRICTARLGIWPCDFPSHRELISVLINTGHIDLVLEDNDLVERFSLNYSQGIYGQRNAQLMSDYKNDLPNGLIMKADALVRKANFREALVIYKSLLEKGHQWQVADSLRSLLSYYGCTTDVEIWGEFTNAEPSELVRPSGSPYPAQPIFVDNIVDLRIRLRKGEFVPFSPECPLSKLLSEN